MKLLTITVPSYNSEAYLANCLDSLTPFADRLDIIIVNDGSTDRTAAIGAEYVARFPDDIRLINKANGGHGSGINVGLKEARAPWFKVVDSDDRLAASALSSVLSYLEKIYRDQIPCDLLLTDYVFDYRTDDGNHSYKTVSLANLFFPERRLGWADMGTMRFDQLLMMHTLIYRTDLLREIDLRLPEKTFYEDNIYAFEPFPYVKDLHYLNVGLYLYFIGRPGQSVNLDSQRKNADMTFNITRRMLTTYSLAKLKQLDRPLSRSMIRHLRRMVAMCYLVTGISPARPDLKTNLEELRQTAEKFDPRLAQKIWRHPMILGQRLLSLFGDKATEGFYTRLAGRYGIN